MVKSTTATYSTYHALVCEQLDLAEALGEQCGEDAVDEDEWDRSGPIWQSNTLMRLRRNILSMKKKVEELDWTRGTVDHDTPIGSEGVAW